METAGSRRLSPSTSLALGQNHATDPSPQTGGGEVSPAAAEQTPRRLETCGACHSRSAGAPARGRSDTDGVRTILGHYVARPCFSWPALKAGVALLVSQPGVIITSHVSCVSGLGLGLRERRRVRCAPGLGLVSGTRSRGCDVATERRAGVIVSLESNAHSRCVAGCHLIR
jgi:hypothetical protein